ncbi:hypothetical protein GCM10010273_21050 [Streptomyces lavendulocolor]
MAALTDRELPQVEKKVWSAPTASAISSCALASTPWEEVRSSSPLVARTSERKTASPSTARTRGSAPRPCLWPGGVKGVWFSEWYAASASSTGACEWSMAPRCPANQDKNRPAAGARGAGRDRTGTPTCTPVGLLRWRR